MIILVDMDEVIVELEKKIIELLIKENPEKKDLINIPRTKFKLTNQYPDIEDKLKEIASRKGLTENLEPVEGSIEALKKIESLGHKIFICTAPLTNYKNSVLEKYKWIEKNLGIDWTKKIILTKDKTLIKGDILIDDNPSINGIKNPEWEHILFDKPYNKDVIKKRLTWKNYKQVLNI